MQTEKLNYLSALCQRAFLQFEGSCDWESQIADRATYHLIQALETIAILEEVNSDDAENAEVLFERFCTVSQVLVVWRMATEEVFRNLRSSEIPTIVESLKEGFRTAHRIHQNPWFASLEAYFESTYKGSEIAPSRPVFRKERLDDDELTVAETAEYLGVAPNTVSKYIMRNEFPYTKPGGKIVKIKKSDLDAWKNRSRHKSRDELESLAASKLLRRN